MDSQIFLDRAAKASTEPIYVVTGEEDFLKRQVLAAIRRIVLGSEEDSFGLTSYTAERIQSEKIPFSEIRAELETLPFAAPRRLVMIESADKFVTESRPLLEKYFAQPSATGTLVLEVKTWPANTKLAKALKDQATIVCKAPHPSRLPPWCTKWM